MLLCFLHPPLPPFVPTWKKRDAANGYIKYLMTVKVSDSMPWSSLLV